MVYGKVGLPSPGPFSGFFSLVKSGLPVLFLEELTVLNPPLVGRKLRFLLALWLALVLLYLLTSARAIPGLWPLRWFFYLPQWPHFNIFDQSWFKKPNVIIHAKCTQTLWNRDRPQHVRAGHVHHRRPGFYCLWPSPVLSLGGGRAAKSPHLGQWDCDL